MRQLRCPKCGFTAPETEFEEHHLDLDEPLYSCPKCGEYDLEDVTHRDVASERETKSMSDEERYYQEHGVGPTRPVTPNPSADAIAQRFVADFNDWTESLSFTERERERGVMCALMLASAATATFLESGDTTQLALWEAIKERLAPPESGQPLTVATTTNRSGPPPQRVVIATRQPMYATGDRVRFTVDGQTYVGKIFDWRIYLSEGEPGYDLNATYIDGNGVQRQTHIYGVMESQIDSRE